MKIILLEVSTDLTVDQLKQWITDAIEEHAEDDGEVTLSQQPHVQEVKELR